MKNFNFDFVILEKFVVENLDFLQGARIQKIQQPTRQEIILGIRNKGESRKFYINISPDFFHICFMNQENEIKRRLEIPKSPPMFCMLLRKYLEGAKIAKIEQPKSERILEFYFETYNELSEKIYLCLAIELMGKHSNVVLYNYDTNMIIGCAHNVGAEKSSVREIIGGLPYAYPPRKINRIISGLSNIIKDTTNINGFIDDYFAKRQEEKKINSIKTKLLALTNSKLKKNINSIQKLKKQSTSEEKAKNYRKKGDLIMGNLFNLQDFSSHAKIFDYEKNEEIEIQLNETKTLKENANQFYKLYNKAKTANEKTKEILESLDFERKYLEQILYSIDYAEKIEDLLEIQEEIEKSNKKTKGQERIEAKGKKQNAKSNMAHPLKLNLSPFTIFVGKNNKQNDYIISKLAKDNDLWFHTHTCAGSHVLLRVEAGNKVTDEIIFECAKLAKEYSAGKNSSKIGVIYTQAKNLRKPPATPLGYVTYKGEKEIIID